MGDLWNITNTMVRYDIFGFVQEWGIPVIPPKQRANSVWNMILMNTTEFYMILTNQHVFFLN